jgi:hypothetical protein
MGCFLANASGAFPSSSLMGNAVKKNTPGEESGGAAKQNPGEVISGVFERLAATYSRRTYRTTTIGNAVFDGRVRNGNGSDHSFMATKY